ncbi:MAG: ABC transporter substrate-binding protein/permease [Bacteriovorax sp.]
MKWILYLIIVSLTSSSLFCSNSWAKIPNPLKWAADTESGAPFAMVTNDPKNPLIGFEVEIMQAISKELGVKLEFVQNAWDGLIPGLKNNNYDVAINGIEITPDRQTEVSFSRPYYSTFEQLVVRSNQEGIESLSDCKKKKVGTLKFSLAQRMLEAEGDIEILTYESEVAAYSDLKNKRSDAVLLDAPIAIYYAKPDMALKFVGAPIGQILYGIAINKENKELWQAVDGAIKKMSKNGKLREILDRWNLWNPLMANLLNDPSPSRTPPVAYQDFLQRNSEGKSLSVKLQQYSSFLPALLKGALMTLKVSLLGMIIAIIVGFILAVMKIYGNPLLSWSATFYIEIIRGTPLLIQLFFIFYGLPYLGVKLSPFVAGIFGLGLNYAAYEAENYRAGIFAVPKAQVEAAMALGMNYRQALMHVILPQAFRISLPPMTNDFISLLKDSSLVSAITMVELTKVYGQLASTYYDYFGTGILVASIYLFLGLPFIRIARYFERKLNVELKGRKFIA